MTIGSGQRALQAACALALAAGAGAVLAAALTRASEAAQEAAAFDAPAGLVLNYVEAGRAEDFESVTSRLHGALAASGDARLRAQASGWRMYRAQQPGPDGNVLYVWLFDPAAPDADYSVAHLLGEAFPDEVQSLYETYVGAFGAGQSRIGMEPVAAPADDEF